MSDVTSPSPAFAERLLQGGGGAGTTVAEPRNRRKVLALASFGFGFGLAVLLCAVPGARGGEDAVTMAWGLPMQTARTQQLPQLARQSMLPAGGLHSVQPARVFMAPAAAAADADAAASTSGAASALSEKIAAFSRRGVLAASGALAAAMLLGPSPAALAKNVALPPIDTSVSTEERCARGFVGNTIGQANAVSDKLLDLRQCDFSGADLKGKTLAGALMSETKFNKADMKEAVLTKSYSVGADFSGVDFSNAVLDRSVFDKSNFRGANFYNAVLTGTSFEGADLTDATFENALIGQEDTKRMCLNPTLKDPEARVNVGCKN